MSDKNSGRRTDAATTSRAARRIWRAVLTVLVPRGQLQHRRPPRVGQSYWGEG